MGRLHYKIFQRTKESLLVSQTLKPKNINCITYKPNEWTYAEIGGIFCYYNFHAAKHNMYAGDEVWIVEVDEVIPFPQIYTLKLLLPQNIEKLEKVWRIAFEMESSNLLRKAFEHWFGTDVPIKSHPIDTFAARAIRPLAKVDTETPIEEYLR